MKTKITILFLTFVSFMNVMSQGLELSKERTTEVYWIKNGHLERIQGTGGLRITETSLQIIGEKVISNADAFWESLGSDPIPTMAIPCSTNVYNGHPLTTKKCGKLEAEYREEDGTFKYICNVNYPNQMCWAKFTDNAGKDIMVYTF